MIRLSSERAIADGYSPQHSKQRPGRGDISDADDSWLRQSPDKLGLPDSFPSAGSGHSRSPVDNEQRGVGA